MKKRLHNLPTLRIDPEQKINFKYNGKNYSGFNGDTIATALYANGIRIFSRSLKYHRPRGLYSLDGECSNTFMEVNDIPNVACEKTLLKQGDIVKEQNVLGTANHDMMAFIDKLDWLMPAGFYYKTMHKPAKIWPFAMKLIRMASGLGSISPDFEIKGKFDEIYPSADVCIIGAGPAGMSAALTAAKRGLRVIILESRPWTGGHFDYRTSYYNTDQSHFNRARELTLKIEKHPKIRLFKHAPAIGTYHNNLITGFQIGDESDSFTQRYIEIRAKNIIIATGCIERPLIFENNDLPCIMQIACAHRMARTYGILPGNNCVFSIGDDSGLEAACDLSDLGLDISCIADIREDGHNPELLNALARKKIKVLKGWVVLEAIGKKHVEGVIMKSLDGTMSCEYDCDLLVASAGKTPLTGHISLLNTKLKYDDYTGFFLPENLPENVFTAGRILGIENSYAIEKSGELAGLKAAFNCGSCEKAEITSLEDDLKNIPGPVRGNKFVTASVKGDKSFICFDEDTTIKNIKQAVNMGFDIPELIKRFTSAGTGPCQGGISGHNLPLFISKYRMLSDNNLKPTTVRPPIVPAYIATYAGSKHTMTRLTPIDDIQRADGGKFERVGVWERARYFSNDYTCKEEIENVRNNVGMLDASTLGKFRLYGPDSLNVLQRVYVSDMTRLKKGKVKYSAMCNDDGCVIDDGVVVKIDDYDYYFTTSTGRAGSTIEWIKYHTRYDQWDFHLVNLTDAMGVINLAGPNARKVFQEITDEDINNSAFPYSGYREMIIKNTIPVRVMRLGFVGELSYEFHVPSSYMPCLWNMLKDSGRKFNIKNFGLEAQNVLRMEKCHIILGSESEQRTNLLDLGLGYLWDRNKSEAKTVGAIALKQAENDVNRLKLVGFKMINNHKAPLDGSLIVDSRIRGYVCTARNSFTLNEAVGMALVESELSNIGTTLNIFEDGSGNNRIYAKVVPMPFYDPEGVQMKS